MENEALKQLARQVEEAQELSDAAALAAGANDELIEAVATAVHLGGSAEDLDDADIIAQSEAGSSVRIPEPETKKEAGEPGAWLPPETAGIVEPGAEGAIAEAPTETPYNAEPTAPATPIGESEHKGGMAHDTSLAVSEATLHRILEMNQLAMNKNIEQSMAPTMHALKACRTTRCNKRTYSASKKK